MVIHWFIVFRDAAIVVTLSAVLAVVVNSFRSKGAIELIAKKNYEIIVPCPEFLGRPAQPIDPIKVKIGKKGLLLVDAREKEAFQKWTISSCIKNAIYARASAIRTGPTFQAGMFRDSAARPTGSGLPIFVLITVKNLPLPEKMDQGPCF